MNRISMVLIAACLLFAAAFPLLANGNGEPDAPVIGTRWMPDFMEPGAAIGFPPVTISAASLPEPGTRAWK